MKALLARSSSCLVRLGSHHTKVHSCIPYPMLLSRSTSLLQIKNEIQTVVPPSFINTPEHGTAQFLLRFDLLNFYEDIRETLSKTEPELKKIAQYYFNGDGKAVRPVVGMCMAKAINYHLNQRSPIVIQMQKKVVQISEMIHTASLIHDDVIDGADRRRSRPSINTLWDLKKVITAGNFVCSIVLKQSSSLKNEEIIKLLMQILADIVEGELMQIAPRENEKERFDHYLEKTFKKTASLFAHSFKAERTSNTPIIKYHKLKCILKISILSGADSTLQNVAFQFGHHLGMAFQLVDDLLDFTATSAQLGKLSAIDLRLGLATAPVLFAAEKFPELNPLITRRFQEKGDAETAFQLVLFSDGLQRTKELASQYCINAVTQLAQLAPSPYQQALVMQTNKILHRVK